MELFPKLGSVPAPTTEPAWRQEPVSPAQINTIRLLRQERDDTGMGPIPDDLTKGKASDAIAWLKARPLRPLPNPGYYRTGDNLVYELRRTQDQKRMYVLRFDNETGKFIYSPDITVSSVAQMAVPTDDPRRTIATSVPSTPAGFYEVKGQVYRVVESERGYLYVLTLDMDNLTMGEKMLWHKGITLGQLAVMNPQPISIETVKDLGAITQFCVFCNRELSNNNSTEAGYGPRCAEKYNLPWG